MRPILLDLPMPLTTKRLSLRPLQSGDGKQIFTAVEESRDHLAQWLPWPKHVKSWEDSEIYARESYAKFIRRESLILGIFHSNTEEFIGVCGFNYFLWHIPSAEIGYWCRSSYQNKGYIQEATAALADYGFDRMGLKRMAITCLDNNLPSAAVAEKLNFDLEVRALGLMKNHHNDALAMSRRYVKIKNDPPLLSRIEEE